MYIFANSFHLFQTLLNCYQKYVNCLSARRVASGPSETAFLFMPFVHWQWFCNLHKAFFEANTTANTNTWNFPMNTMNSDRIAIEQWTHILNRIIEVYFWGFNSKRSQTFKVSDWQLIRTQLNYSIKRQSSSLFYKIQTIAYQHTSVPDLWRCIIQHSFINSFICPFRIRFSLVML